MNAVLEARRALVGCTEKQAQQLWEKLNSVLSLWRTENKVDEIKKWKGAIPTLGEIPEDKRALLALAENSYALLSHLHSSQYQPFIELIGGNPRSLVEAGRLWLHPLFPESTNRADIRHLLAILILKECAHENFGPAIEAAFELTRRNWMQEALNTARDAHLTIDKITSALPKMLAAAVKKAESKQRRDAVNAKHDKPGGSRDKAKKIRDTWASGIFDTRDSCAEQEYAALKMSFSSARKALRNTPDPAVKEWSERRRASREK
jgi:hypothetical protein